MASHAYGRKILIGYGDIAMAEQGIEKLEDEPPRTFAPNAVQMLRTVQANTMALSAMADQKASILMGATFVVFSISVSRALTQDLPLSLTVLAIFAFASSLCAVIAILPSITKPKPASLTSIPANLLFFGHYTGVAEEEWAASVLDQMGTEEEMYRMMLRDIYQNGQVLQKRKYRFLTNAYRLFVFGLVLTVIIFLFEIGLFEFGGYLSG
ncbi:Pycsar system effector family protein [Erythrobacter sp. W53]|uniref:Pycsar system effector family protein n=1 Tax=Erythrobacter sp. W53 TaxID=3425947 RepID=UPI003D768357